MTVAVDGTKVKTRGGKVRFSYSFLINPKREEENGKITEKYSVCVLIPKEETEIIDAINQAVQTAIDTKPHKDWKGKVPKLLKLPLRDGDAEGKEDESYHGCMFFNCSSGMMQDKVTPRKPVVINAQKEPIESEDVFYSGCYGNVSVSAFTFGGKNPGVGFILNGAQKTKDGERLAGGGNAMEDFDEEEDQTDDFSLD